MGRYKGVHRVYKIQLIHWLILVPGNFLSIKCLVHTCPVHMPWQAPSEDLEKLHSVSISHLDLQSCLSENNTTDIRLINGTWNMAFFPITMQVLTAWKVNVCRKMYISSIYISSTLDKADIYAVKWFQRSQWETQRVTTMQSIPCQKLVT